MVSGADSSSFQSTPSAWRETICRQQRTHLREISIHSLRMEGDSNAGKQEKQSEHFNPLPPHGGRRSFLPHQIASFHFNPLPPHGGRLLVYNGFSAVFTFQSTPSAWRETQKFRWHIVARAISIHSLRMEGDLSPAPIIRQFVISIHSLRMEGDSKTAQESVFHFAYPCTILQKRMQKTTFCTRKNGFFRKKGEKFGAKPSASFCAPMIRTDTFPLNFSHRISGSSMSMVSFAPICSTFD